MEGLDLGNDLKDRKRQRERSRDSRKASGKSTTSKSGLQHMEASNNDVTTMKAHIRMPAYLSKTKSEITEAFTDLEWKQRLRLAGATSNPNSPFKLKSSLSIVQRNRYNNVQPWDNSRIQLKTPIGGSDYVNASPIKLHSISPRAKKRLRRTSSINSTSSLSGEEYSYIASQGPKEGQYSHFWHMVMQESTGDVGVVVMLTPCIEGNREKCAQYFPVDKLHPIVLAPEKRGSGHVATAASHDESRPSSASIDASASRMDEASDMTEAGQVELISYSDDVEIGCTIRTLRLSIGSQQKTIIHYLYEHWPDFGKPEPEERASLLRLLRKSRESAGEGPRIVHCSAGVGRTGTFIALDFLTAELEAGRLAWSDDTSEEQSDGPIASTTESEQAQKPSESYGKSGIAKSKVKTPELRQGDDKTDNSLTNDLIHDTVDSLRQQRMMMVMNEIQYSLLYEILKESFIDLYSTKPTGATVTAATADASAAAAAASSEGSGDRRAKVARTASDVHMTTSSSPAPQSPRDSEADTDIAGALSPDPYAEVAPERIRENLGLHAEG